MTATLHNVDLTELETLPNGYILARKADGGLAVHDRAFFHGSAYFYGGDRYAVQWNDPPHGWRLTRRFKTLRGADRFLERKARALPSRG